MYIVNAIDLDRSEDHLVLTASFLFGVQAQDSEIDNAHHPLARIFDPDLAVERTWVTLDVVHGIVLELVIPSIAQDFSMNATPAVGTSIAQYITGSMYA